MSVITADFLSFSPNCIPFGSPFRYHFVWNAYKPILTPFIGIPVYCISTIFFAIILSKARFLFLLSFAQNTRSLLLSFCPKYVFFLRCHSTETRLSFFCPSCQIARSLFIVIRLKRTFFPLSFCSKCAFSFSRHSTILFPLSFRPKRAIAREVEKSPASKRTQTFPLKRPQILICFVWQNTAISLFHQIVNLFHLTIRAYNFFQRLIS